MGTSVSGRSCFALILATLSGLSSLPSAYAKARSGMEDGSISGACLGSCFFAGTGLQDGISLKVSFHEEGFFCLGLQWN